MFAEQRRKKKERIKEKKTQKICWSTHTHTKYYKVHEKCTNCTIFSRTLTFICTFEVVPTHRRKNICLFICSPCVSCSIRNAKYVEWKSQTIVCSVSRLYVCVYCVLCTVYTVHCTLYEEKKKRKKLKEDKDSIEHTLINERRFR